MRVIQNIVAENYRMKHLRLEEFKDLNILIGPSNCGKSTVLEIIEQLNTLSSDLQNYECSNCKVQEAKIPGLSCSIQPKAKYLRKRKIKISFELNKEQMEKTFPRESVQQAGPDLLKIMDHVGTTIALTEKPHNILQSEHVFPYDLSILRRELTSVLRCPEERLQSYKNKNITDYIKEQNLNATVMEELMKIMKEIVDSKIRTYKTATLDFVRNISNEDFDTTIAEQGSGVRSLICLIVDVLSQQQAKIVLIDEPEIGLNPSGKHGLLRFLMQQAERKQIFVATHDPTFVNPVLWQRENVALFLFSPVDDTFVKIDLNQSKQSPSTFGGFLPPTTSLRKIHLYVEGDSDVYIFQSFLRMFLQEEYPEDWYEKFNKVGVFHLAGDFWCHLMYTIPQTPYHSVIILDGDKKDRARKTVEDMNKVTQLPNWPDRFKFCETTNQIKHPGRPWIGIDLIPIPVYCLKQQEIEDYLQPKPIDKGKGPDIAEKMESVPSEIKEIFRSLRLEKD